MAWHWLSREQKDILEDRRDMGEELFGGDRFHRPRYWFLVEEGMPKVGVPARHYISNAVNSVTANLDRWTRSIIRRVTGLRY